MIRTASILIASLLAAQSAAGEIAFEDASAALPVKHNYTGGWEHFVGGGVAVLDCNGDQLPDIFAAGGTSVANLFVNRSKSDLKFHLSQNIPRITGATGAYPIDVDSDGIIDLAVLRVGQNLLLRGTGDCGFVDAGDKWGFKSSDRWSTALSATWEPGNLLPTLAIGNYVDRSDPDGPFEACDINELYRPTGSVYAQPLKLAPGYCALSMLFSDWNRKGSAELRISNDRHYYVRNGHEQMWRLSPLSERGQADGWNRISIWGMGIASADLQHDGYPDVILTSMGDQVLFFNHEGDLTAADYSKGTTAHRPHIGDDGRPSTGWHAEFADVDNNGLLDLFIAKGNVDQMPSNAMRDPNNLLMQSPNGSFVEASAVAGIATTERARGAALADFDQDGRLDLVVVNRRAPMELWLNKTKSAGNWATVELQMSGANRFAIGAWLEIARDKGSEWRERTIGGGHVSGSLQPFHIGLGKRKSIRFRVWWPDGTATQWRDIVAGQRLTLHR